MRLGFSYNVLSAVAPRAAAFYVTVIASHALAMSDFGYLSLVILSGESLDAILFNGIRRSIFATEGTADRVTLRSLVATGLGLLALLVALRFSGVIADSAPPALKVVAATICYAYCTFTNKVFLAFLQRDENVHAYAAQEILRAVILVFLSTTVWAQGLGWFDYILATCFSLQLACFLSVYLTAKREKTAKATKVALFGRRHLIDNLNHLIGLSCLSLFGVFAQSTDKMLFAFLWGAGPFAAYYALSSVSRQIMDTIGQAVNLSCFPRVLRAGSASHADRPEVMTAELTYHLTLILLFFLPMIAGSLFVAPQVCSYVFPTDYCLDSRVLLPVLMLGGLAANLKTFVVDNILHARNDYRRLFNSAALAASAGVGTSLVLVPNFGSVGAAASVFVASAAGLACSCFFCSTPLKATLQHIRWLPLLAQVAGLCLIFFAVGQLLTEKVGTPVAILLGGAYALAFVFQFVRNWK